MSSINFPLLRESFENAELKIFNSFPVHEYFETVVDRVDRLRDDFHISVIGEVPLGSVFLPIYRIATPHLQDKANTVLLTAGVHGNEQGGVCGALNFMQEDALYLDSDIGVICYPCINPRGLVLNSRWAGDGPHNRTDLNRNFIDESDIKEVKLLIASLRQTARKYLASIDLHETMPQDNLVMMMQYSERDINPYKETPDSFYMWEICNDRSKRIGNAVIERLKESVSVCDWERIFDDYNSGGVIFYPEGGVNQDYVNEGPLDYYLQKNFTNHSFTTETYGDICVTERGKIQQKVIKLIVNELLRNSNGVGSS